MYRVQGSLREWVTRDEVRRFIAKKFEEFLLTYVNSRSGHGDFEYVRLINEMVSGEKSAHFGILVCDCLCYITYALNSVQYSFILFGIEFAANKCSLEIDYKKFICVHPNIAIWLADAPQSVLEVMEDVAMKVVFDLHPNYKNIHQKIYVRIANLPVHDQIRNIRYC